MTMTGAGRLPDDVSDFTDPMKCRITMPIAVYAAIELGGLNREIQTEEIRDYFGATKAINIAGLVYQAKTQELLTTAPTGMGNRNMITLNRDAINDFMEKRNLSKEFMAEWARTIQENPEQIANNHVMYKEQNPRVKSKRENSQNKQTDKNLSQIERGAIDSISTLIEASNRRAKVLRQIRTIINKELQDMEV